MGIWLSGIASGGAVCVCGITNTTANKQSSLVFVCLSVCVQHVIHVCGESFACPQWLCPLPFLLPPPLPLTHPQVLGRQCGSQGWPGEQVVVMAAAKRYIRAAIKLAARGQYSKKEGE